jgi:hypothetical protein
MSIPVPCPERRGTGPVPQAGRNGNRAGREDGAKVAKGVGHEGISEEGRLRGVSGGGGRGRTVCACYRPAAIGLPDARRAA